MSGATEGISPGHGRKDVNAVRCCTGLGLNPTLHGHLFRLEVWSIDPHLHVCDVEATP